MPVEAYKERYAYTGGGLIEYIGRAEPGKSISSAVWQIKKMSYDGSNIGEINWASSVTNFIHYWSGLGGLGFGTVGTTYADYVYG